MDATHRAAEGDEPHLLLVVETGLPGRLVRVSRPGRGARGSQGRVEEAVVSRWIDAVVAALGARGAERPVHYVCLLGTKSKGRSEIAGFYDARAPWESSTAPLFEDWLNEIAGARSRFVVHHFATVDGEPIPEDVVDQVCRRLRELLAEGNLVALGCSAAERRSRDILDRLGWIGPSGR
ncbi:MAG: hypothetical protein ACKPBU_01130 [Alphaproteobacteria bacterium]